MGWKGSSFACNTDGVQVMLVNVNVLFHASIKAEQEDFVSQIIDALLRESKKESITYKLEALSCFGEVLEVLSVDRFSDVYSIMSPVLEKEESMEVDGEKEELSSEVKQKQLVCYFTVLGQAWPEIQSTQDEYMERYGCMMCKSLQSNTWRIQEAILKSMHKYLTRLCCLKDVSVLEKNQDAMKLLLENIITSISPCLGNLKYTVIRSEALVIVEDIVPTLQGFGKLPVLSQEILEILKSDMTSLTSDTSPELQDKAATILKIIAG